MESGVFKLNKGTTITEQPTPLSSTSRDAQRAGGSPADVMHPVNGMVAAATPDAARSAWIMFIGPGHDDHADMVEAFRSLGLTLAIADDFHEAKRVLSAQPPDLLVTHVRLGEYNGLQLVLRGKTTRPGMAAIVVADGPDPVLERDAAEMDATLVLSTAGRDEWIAAALRAIPQERHSGD